MEGAALNTPPEMLDRVVRLLIPPAAREAVVGDLWETYRSPSQYAGEALRTVPYVVFSQMRRYFNLPVLLLQAMLLYACFGPVTAALLLPVLMVADAYQPVSRPTPRRAMRGAVLVAFALVVFLQVAWSSYHSHSPLTVDGVWLGIGLFFIAPCLVPFLCLLRAGLIVSSDRRPTLANREWTAAELANAERRCETCDAVGEITLERGDVEAMRVEHVGRLRRIHAPTLQKNLVGQITHRRS